MSRQVLPSRAESEPIPFTTQFRDFLTLLKYMGICMGLILLVNLLVALMVIGTFHWVEQFLSISLR